jgi:peptidoglycan biosynthesis protein MviN/MurJ (putative lipid II flippase)
VVYLLIFSRMLKILIPAFTPVFIEEKNKRGERAAWDFASTVINLTFIGAALVLVVFYAYAEPITDTLVRGFSPEARELGIRLLRWILPGAALMMLYLPLRSVLNCYKVFSYPAAAEAAQKLLWAGGIIVAYYLLHIVGVLAIALGFLVGSAGMVAVTLLGMRSRVGLYRPSLPSLSAGRFVGETLIGLVFLLCAIVCLMLIARALPPAYKYRDLIQLTLALCAVMAYCGQLWLRARKRTGVMAVFAALSVPMIVSTLCAAYRDTITFYFQSFTAQGVFSDIEYARRVVLVPSTVLAYALSVAMFPYLCELASKEDRSALAGITTKAFRMLALAFVPLTVVMIVLADPISRLALDRGDWQDVHLRYAALALVLLTTGLVIYCWEYVITQAYFSLKWMWTPALMGIVATVFQAAFLAVPIYVLGYDYPVHIFFLAALAFPVSRVFKNLILLALLRRRLPILPLRDTLVFAGNLLVLSGAVGLATWGTYQVVRRHVSFEQYRQHKVVIDNFETGPDTWFSLNAKEVSIVRMEDDAQGLAVMMRYDRHGETQPSLYREMQGIRTEDAQQLKVFFDVYSAQPARGIALEVERGGKRERVFEDKSFAGGWETFTAVIDRPAGIVRLHWLEASPGAGGENRLYLLNVAMADGTGRFLWEENLRDGGWKGLMPLPDERQPGLVDTQPGAVSPRYALEAPVAVYGARKDIAGFDLSGTDQFRCRLMPRGDKPTFVTLRLVGPGGSVTRREEVTAGKWKTVDLAWKDMGFASVAEFRAVQRIEVETTESDVLLDDVTFRRPQQRMMYEAMKFIHCAVPSLAGLVVGIVCLLILKFPEVDDVVRWVRDRGWRRRKEAADGLPTAES